MSAIRPAPFSKCTAAVSLALSIDHIRERIIYSAACNGALREVASLRQTCSPFVAKATDALFASVSLQAVQKLIQGSPTSSICLGAVRRIILPRSYRVKKDVVSTCPAYVDHLLQPVAEAISKLKELCPALEQVYFRSGANTSLKWWKINFHANGTYELLGEVTYLAQGEDAARGQRWALRYVPKLQGATKTAVIVDARLHGICDVDAREWIDSDIGCHPSIRRINTGSGPVDVEGLTAMCARRAQAGAPGLSSLICRGVLPYKLDALTRLLKRMPGIRILELESDVRQGSDRYLAHGALAEIMTAVRRHAPTLEEFAITVRVPDPDGRWLQSHSDPTLSHPWQAWLRSCKIILAIIDEAAQPGHAFSREWCAQIGAGGGGGDQIDADDSIRDGPVSDARAVGELGGRGQWSSYDPDQVAHSKRRRIS